MTVAQASLTGELMPVEKNTRLSLPPPEYTFDIIDNENICLAGTSVSTGSGRAMVISTGGETYMASIAKDLAKKRPLNSVQLGVRRVSYILLAFMGVSGICALYDNMVLKRGMRLLGDGARCVRHSRSN